MRIIIFLFLMLSSLAFGEEWRAADGEFMAMMFLSDKPEEVYSAWNNSPASKIKVSALPSISNGKAFEAIVIFSGCAADKNGNCNVIANWKIETLDGQDLGQIKDAHLWVNRKAPISGQLQISEKGVGMVASKKDKGYLIKVQIKDVISGRSVRLVQSTSVKSG